MATIDSFDRHIQNILNTPAGRVPGWKSPGLACPQGAVHFKEETIWLCHPFPFGSLALGKLWAERRVSVRREILRCAQDDTIEMLSSGLASRAYWVQVVISPPPDATEILR